MKKNYIKRYAYCGMAKFRRWANTEQGGRIVVRTGGTIMVLLVVNIALLILGIAIQ